MNLTEFLGELRILYGEDLICSTTGQVYIRDIEITDTFRPDWDLDDALMEISQRIG